MTVHSEIFETVREVARNVSKIQRAVNRSGSDRRVGFFFEFFFFPLD